MEKILFRGQTRRYGEKVRIGDGFKLPSRWVYGGVLQGVSAHSIIYGGENADNPSEGLDKWVVYTDTLGQFTGLTDKNGKKIFEGDICRVSRPCVIAYGHIEFKSGCFWFVDHGPGGLLRLCDVRMNGFTIEIIGNIHDKTELLEVHENGTV